MAASLVSHCYRRPTYDDWPYSIFTMVHGKNAKDRETTIAAIRDETGVDEYAPCGRSREEDPRYFTDDWSEWRRAWSQQAERRINVERVCADTPSCATSPPQQCGWLCLLAVVDTVIEHLELEAGIEATAGDAVAERSAAVYQSVAAS
jgi:hypothetical protein